MNNNQYYAADGFPLGWKNNFANNNTNYNTPFVFSSYIDENTTPISKGNYSFNITQTHLNASISLRNNNSVARVLNSIFIADGNELIFLGENNNLDYDYHNNIVTTSFYPEWFCLPDGQFLSGYIVCHFFQVLPLLHLW